MSEKHLGTDDELISFMKEMKNQLIRHQNEKQSMRNWTYNEVMKNNIPEIKTRISDIDTIWKMNLDTVERQQKVIREKVIAKQFVHIANYCMMGWLKSK